MKTFDYIKNIIKVMIWPILFGIGQFFIILIFTFSFNNNIYNNLVESNSSLTTEEINEMFNIYMNSDEYKSLLTEYINDNTLLIVLIVAVIFIPLLIYKYKKIKPKLNFKINKKYINIIFFGISLSLIFNLIIININNIFKIENGILNNKYLISTIIASGIIGPIIEELIFRGMIFNKIKQFNKLVPSILISTFIFAFFHDSTTDMIYAFIVGYICIKLYINFDTLLAPIVFHISGNIIVPIFNNIFLNLEVIYVILILVLCLASLIINLKLLNNKNK